MSEEIFLFYGFLIWRQIVSDTGDKFLLEEGFKGGFWCINSIYLFWSFGLRFLKSLTDPQFHETLQDSARTTKKVKISNSLFEVSCLYFIYSKSFLKIFCIKRTNFPRWKNYSFLARVNHRRKSSKKYLYVKLQQFKLSL